MARILAVDDEPAVLYALAEVLAPHEIVRASSGKEALGMLEGVDAVVTDLSMPGMSGVDLLAAIRDQRPHVPVVLLTARGSERDAVQAIKGGAYDYLTKPFDVDELRGVVARAIEVSLLRQKERRALGERALGHELIGESAAMKRLLAAIDRVAPRDVNVLVTGETGTGKEIVATLLHASSARSGSPLVRFNAAAIPEQLAEAEMFGHERGAFTGATASRRGYFAQAHRGTLVLDEVGELPLPLQAKLLRAVQDGEIQPLGGRGVEKVDVRIVACTHRDLRAEARAGRFREDLYYRLAVVELSVPALRDRRNEIAPLARSFTAGFAARFGLENVSLSDDLVAALESLPWPGNVRELQNTVARLVALSDGGPIPVRALGTMGEATASAPRGSYQERMTTFERDLLADALATAKGNKSAASRSLGMSRVTLLDRLKRYDLG